MTEAITYRIGFDVAKGVFQVHGVTHEPGEPVAIKRRLRRGAVTDFFAKLPPSLIGMEACGSAHYWARVAQRHGHDVRLMPPAYVKAYVKRNKTDAHDAAAICEAVPTGGRPYMTGASVCAHRRPWRTAPLGPRASMAGSEMVRPLFCASADRWN